jgi:putative ABC transport system permease protein
MKTLWSDARHAARALFKRPGFTLVVTLTLALGIGANTAIFSLIYGILLRPFPYLEPDRLVKIESVYTQTTGSVQGASQLDLDDWRRHTKSFDDFGLHITYPAILNIGRGPSQSVRLTFVTARMFETLGVHPIIGRNFNPEEDIVGGAVLKAALSYGLWQTTFGGDRNVVGRAIRLRGATYTIIGVAIGLLAALALSRLMKSLLFDVAAIDPLTFVAVSLLLVCVAAVACFIPARRVAKTDPIIALRDE